MAGLVWLAAEGGVDGSQPIPDLLRRTAQRVQRQCNLYLDLRVERGAPGLCLRHAVNLQDVFQLSTAPVSSDNRCEVIRVGRQVFQRLQAVPAVMEDHLPAGGPPA